ncbi:diaminopimelate decarboxylase [Curtobacterium ammoniigenes]|uniref:diaminopimelate decarboxylase n=1 Tax=Curtobacterium ammoniigenes TaxID=395387 RepID=UPI000836657C|nr:diaminopimelate decarboxylase [Curtobacterium ammoniigenes]
MTGNPLAPSWLAVPADPEALDPRIWPSSATRTDDGALAIGGMAASDLIARFGSPLYVLDERDLQSRAVRVRTAFADAFEPLGVRTIVYYAGKALLTAQVAAWMAEADLHIDVATDGELATALAGGVDAARLGLHGNNKSDAEIDMAVRLGVGTIVLDSADEVERVAAAAGRYGVRQRVRLRINSGVHASTHEYLATAHEDQKFGVPIGDAPAIVETIRASEGLAFVGLHSHIGSQIFDAAGFREAARRLVALHALLAQSGPVPELNLGGGWGIDYTSADTAFEPEDIAVALAEILVEQCAEHGIPVPQIAVEPGRYIAGPAGVTLYTVGTVKPVAVASGAGVAAQRTYVSVDGGMSDNVRPALYGADYTAALGRRSDAAPMLSRVVGRHCESGDIVVRDTYLPGDTGRGDLLVVAATGAYCWSLSSNYNHVGRPPIVAVADGAARILVRGETIDDLLARDTGLTD